MSATEQSLQAIQPPAALLHMLGGYMVAQAIYVAARLGVADHLADGAKTIQELAETVDAHAGALYRLMRALASIGLFTEPEPQRFALTPIGAGLQTKAPGSLRALALHIGDVNWEVWNHMFHSVKTGETAFRHVHGMEYFEYLQKHPQKGRTFDEAMTGLVSQSIAAIIDAYDFTPFSKVVDIGGGQGALMTAILRANPQTTGVIFDQPSVIERAKRHIEDTGFSNRCECIGGDFFVSVPAGADAYIMASIIHDWDDEHSVSILKSCHRVMSGSEKLLLMEMVIPPNDVPFFGKLLDLEMLVSLGGLERTAAEYRDLLAASGFQIARIVETRGLLGIIEARPI
jgi:ubiquinone/menaquinone biosynthesis C-methylase UbiE